MFIYRLQLVVLVIFFVSTSDDTLSLRPFQNRVIYNNEKKASISDERESKPVIDFSGEFKPQSKRYIDIKKGSIVLYWTIHVLTCEKHWGNDVTISLERKEHDKWFRLVSVDSFNTTIEKQSLNSTRLYRVVVETGEKGVFLNGKLVYSNSYQFSIAYKNNNLVIRGREHSPCNHVYNFLFYDVQYFSIYVRSNMKVSLLSFEDKTIVEEIEDVPSVFHYEYASSFGKSENHLHSIEIINKNEEEVVMNLEFYMSIGKVKPPKKDVFYVLKNVHLPPQDRSEMSENVLDIPVKKNINCVYWSLNRRIDVKIYYVSKGKEVVIYEKTSSHSDKFAIGSFEKLDPSISYYLRLRNPLNRMLSVRVNNIVCFNGLLVMIPWLDKINFEFPLSFNLTLGHTFDLFFPPTSSMLEWKMNNSRDNIRIQLVQFYDNQRNVMLNSTIMKNSSSQFNLQEEFEYFMVFENSDLQGGVGIEGIFTFQMSPNCYLDIYNLIYILMILIVCCVVLLILFGMVCILSVTCVEQRIKIKRKNSKREKYIIMS